MATLERAIEIAAAAHAGQTDKAGHPYIMHPLRVMLAVASPAERIAAVLHDVVEDTPWTLTDLEREGFAPEVLSAVAALTHERPLGAGPPSEEEYLAYVRRAGAHPVARAVKVADLRDHLDPARIPTPTDRDRARLARYRRALTLLDAWLGAPGG
jgi:GTP diphosphokinase / guanosine-3',5'-bis(diphosphate) 3'-diphosphatase